MKKFFILTAALATAGLVQAIDPINGNNVAFVEVSVPGTDATPKTQILSVPFEKCLNSGTAVKLADLVSTFNLVDKADADKASADQLVVLTTTMINSVETPIYYYYYLKTITGGKEWTAIKTTLLDGTQKTEITPPAATDFDIARGKGFWLKRPASASATSLFLKGQIASSSVSVTIKSGLNLISLGSLTSISLNSSSIGWGTGSGNNVRNPGNGITGMDKLLVVKTDGSGDFDEYVFDAADGGKWLDQSGDPTSATVVPGQGLWYLRRGDDNLTFTPVAQ